MLKFSLFPDLIASLSRLQEEAAVSELELSVQSDFMTKNKKISTVSNPSLSSIPSTSGMSLNSARIIPRPAMPKSSSSARIEGHHKSVKVLIDPKGLPTGVSGGHRKVPPPFKKAQSQSHIQVKTNQSTAQVFIENETKKLKKSRSFDKNNYLGEPRHMKDNKKIKTKH
jgi:hypothetical protein